MIRENIRKTWPGIPFAVGFIVIAGPRDLGGGLAGIVADMNFVLLVGRRRCRRW